VKILLPVDNKVYGAHFEYWRPALLQQKCETPAYRQATMLMRIIKD